MNPPVLEADCVGKSFGARRILKAASLRANAGEVRVLFGRNGIGKSTLLRIAAGITAPETGMVRMNGERIARPNLPALARSGVFFLPDHDLLSSTMTLGTQLRLVEQRFGAATAEEAARRANVTAFLDAFPHSLSGGERRRAELSMVLARRPSCLLADEPLRGIAPIDQEWLGVLFRSIAADGCAVVVTGHEVEALMAFADHVTWCTAGTTIELGPPATAMANDAFRRDYAG